MTLQKVHPFQQVVVTRVALKQRVNIPVPQNVNNSGVFYAEAAFKCCDGFIDVTPGGVNDGYLC